MMHVLPFGAGTALWGKGTESMKKLLRTAAAAACLCLLAACAPARQAGGGEPGAPREDFTSVPSGMQAGGEPEAMAAPVAYRAMWVSYLEWPMFDTSGAQGFAASVGSLLDNCAALGLNTVIVQVRPFGDAVYPSAVYPWSHLVTGVQGQDPGYDPLAIFVEQAHARGLAIEAWVNPYRVRLNDTMPPGELAADNPALLHEGWALEANGGLYYDPALPEVQDMVVQGVTEIVQNYDVDGIQFDDYFYPTTDEAFDTESYARYGGGQDLAEWRRANVNTLVQKVYAAVKAVKPEAVFRHQPAGQQRQQLQPAVFGRGAVAFHARLCGLHHAAGLLGLQLYAAEWFGPVRVREYRGRMAGHAPGRFGFAGIRAGRIPYRRGGRLRHRERGMGQRPQSGRYGAHAFRARRRRLRAVPLCQPVQRRRICGTDAGGMCGSGPGQRHRADGTVTRRIRKKRPLYRGRGRWLKKERGKRNVRGKA